MSDNIIDYMKSIDYDRETLRELLKLISNLSDEQIDAYLLQKLGPKND